MKGAWVSFGGWGLVVLGWLANHWLSEVRDRRKETRTQIDAIQAMLQTIREAAVSFHMADTWNAATVARLKMSFWKLESMVLRASVLDKKDIGDWVKAVRQAVTLHNFDSSNFASQPITSSTIAGVEWVIEEMAEALEKGYSSRYPKTFPYYRLSHFEPEI